MRLSAHWVLVTSGLLVAACGGTDVDRFSRGAPRGEGGANAAAGARPVETAGSSAGGASPTPEPPDAGAAGAPEQVPPIVMQPIVMQPVPPTCTEEICNGSDDDCDGIIDEGCPVALLLGNPVQRPKIGDSPGGTLLEDTCNNDELLIGLTVAMGSWLEQVAPICQKFSLAHSSGGKTPYGYSLALGGKRVLPAQPPFTPSSTEELQCSAGTVLVGLRISQQHAFAAEKDYIVVPQISIQCAEPSLTLSDGRHGFEWKNAVVVGPISGDLANGTAWYEADLVNTRDLAVGFHSAAGSWVDRLGLTAAPLGVTLQSQ